MAARSDTIAKVQDAILYSTAHLKETECVYYENHRQLTFESKVLEVFENVKQNKARNIVVVEKTSFYPTSGGQ